MIRNFTLSFLLVLPAILITSQSSAINYNNFGGITPYSLNAGDSLTIVSGNYTGLISSFPAGAKVTVLTGATFNPSPLSFPNSGSAAKGTIYVYGTFKYDGNIVTNTGFTLYNHNLTWITGTTKMNGDNQVWNNFFGATIKFDGAVTINTTNGINNSGTLSFGNNLLMSGTTAFIINKNVITIAGNFQNNGGILENFGRLQVAGSINFNNGLAIINNYCRIIVDGGLTNTSGYVNNYTYIWARSNNGLGNIVNSGNIYNGPNGRIHAVNLDNTGTIKGAGYLYFPGFTKTTNLGTTGVSGITSDTIKFYDVTRTNPTTIYDDQRGIVHPNVVYRVFTAPDSTMAFLPGCTIELASEIPLNVKWNYFYANLSENIPGLNWSAQTDAGTLFEIERSYNGINFSSIDFVASHPGQSAYNYNDKGINNPGAVVYYRIKAVESTGAVKLSETRTVKFTNKAGVTIQSIPNPFTSQFSINYQSSTTEMLFIKVFSLTGQLQFSKNVTVNDGFNSITVREAYSLVKGMYMVQISNGNNLLLTEKIIKQ